MRRLQTFCAAAALAVIAVVATSSAHAGYHLIRWDDTGLCQIWDEAVPTTPYPTNYSTVKHSDAPTFLEALAAKERMMRAGACTF